MNLFKKSRYQIERS